MNSALLVGLKSVDPSAYGGWDGQNGCWGCELDVDNINNIISPLSFNTSNLKTKNATSTQILDGLSEAAKTCQPGDLFVFYFSGHGGQQPDVSGDELDGQDETLVAYDREIIDDELNKVWTKFKSGVRIFMLSDSCNSGTNYRMMQKDIPKSTPIKFFSSTSTKNDFRTKMKAQMIHFGGCRDGFTSTGYQGGGAFTQALCNIWDNGNFNGDYPSFYQDIKSSVTSGQIVQYNQYGPVEDSFIKSKPFGASRSSDSNPTTGNIKSVRCTLDIDESHIKNIRTVINNESSSVLLEALDDALSKRPGSASVSCTGSSSGGVSCTGTVSINW